MHGLQTGARSRRHLLVGVFIAVLCALAWLQAGSARAVISVPSSTITQTAITSPSDPSYFYDPTGGAADLTTGATSGFTVTGTTNSTAPASDRVDIACYASGSFQYTVATGVALNSSGGFSVFVPYSSMESAGIYWPNGSSCQLLAVPAGSEPKDTSGFTGPRVLLAYLQASYPYPGTNLADYTLVAPQLGATNLYTSAGDCGLTGSYLNDPATFGRIDSETFGCADTVGADVDSQLPDPLQVDGVNAYTPFGAPQAYGTLYFDGGLPQASISVSASQNPSNGDMTITETDPLFLCPVVMYGGCSTAYQSAGVEEVRTIKQSGSGHVVEITDTFRSVDGQAHTVSIDVQSEQCFLDRPCNVLDYYGNYFDPSQVSYQFPGDSGYSTYASNDSKSVGSQAPASIYVERNTQPDGSTAGARGAITYFTPPAAPFSFFDYQEYGSSSPATESMLLAPYSLTVPAGGSAQLSYAYSSEFNQSALAGDVQTARDLQSAPTIVITSPSAGSTTDTATVTVAGQVNAATGVKSVTVNGVSASVSGSSFTATVPLTAGSNTLTATVVANSGVTSSTSETVDYSASTTTTSPSPTITPAVRGWAGALWLPIANTGKARRAGRRAEHLTGDVTPGSGAVRYYFAYGIGGRYNRHSRIMRLAAGHTRRRVTLEVRGLRIGARYQYRLVATGEYGHATGRRRTFRVAKVRGR